MSLDRPLLLQEVEASRISKQVVRLPALRTVRLYPSGDTPATQFRQRLSRSQGHRAAGRSKAMVNPSDPSGIQLEIFRLVAKCLNQIRHCVSHFECDW
jgi:hypothetical protein